jgi:hypothetical protein
VTEASGGVPAQGVPAQGVPAQGVPAQGATGAPAEAVAPAERAPAPLPARPVPPTGRSPDPRPPAAPPEAARRAPDGPQEAPPKTDGSWLQRFLRPGRPAAEKPEAPASESAPDTPSAPPETPETESSSPWTAPASREEEERRVQAEVDRRAARAQKAQAQQTRAQQRAVLEQQEREARETDVYKAAELRNQLDALSSQEQFTAALVGAYDQSTLDPLVAALPEPEREALLADVPTGMEGRKQIVERAVERIKAQGAREAEAKLRKSAAFRKQVLADWRRGLHGEEDAPDEPELVGGTNGHRAGPTMNDWLRAHR